MTRARVQIKSVTGGVQIAGTMYPLSNTGGLTVVPQFPYITITDRLKKGEFILEHVHGDEISVNGVSYPISDEAKTAAGITDATLYTGWNDLINAIQSVFYTQAANH